MLAGLIALRKNFVAFRKTWDRLAFPKSQELIYSKIMFLKFWMISAKSLSLVYDEIFHIRNGFAFLHPKGGRNEKFTISHSYAKVSNFYIIYFLHQTVYVQSSRKEFSLSFCFFVFLAFICKCNCVAALLSLAAVPHFTSQSPSNFSSFPRSSSSSRR